MTGSPKREWVKDEEEHHTAASPICSLLYSQGRSMLGVTCVNKVINVNHTESNQYRTMRVTLVRAFRSLVTIQAFSFRSLANLSNNRLDVI